MHMDRRMRPAGARGRGGPARAPSSQTGAASPSPAPGGRASLLPALAGEPPHSGFFVCVFLFFITFFSFLPSLPLLSVQLIRKGIKGSPAHHPKAEKGEARSQERASEREKSLEVGRGGDAAAAATASKESSEEEE